MADETETEVEKRFSSLKILLNLIDRYGVALVFLCAGVWGCWTVGGRLYDDFLIPMRDGHMKFLETSVETQKETSKAVEAIQDVVEETRGDNAAMKSLGLDHFKMTQETHQDVREIKAAVVPPKNTGSPTLAPPLVNRPSPPNIVQPN